jgi:hypothetical protein
MTKQNNHNLSKKQQKQIDAHIGKSIKKHLTTQVKKVKIPGSNTVVHLSSQFKHHVSTAIIAAFSFLIALAWKDLIVAIVKEHISSSAFEKYPYIDAAITAIIITILAVIGISIVTYWAKKPEIITSEDKTNRDKK